MAGWRIAPDSNVIFKFSMPALGLHPPDTELSSEDTGQGRRPQEPPCPSTARQAARPTGGQAKAGSSRDEGQGDITAAGEREQARHARQDTSSLQPRTHTPACGHSPPTLGLRVNTGCCSVCNVWTGRSPKGPVEPLLCGPRGKWTNHGGQARGTLGRSSELPHLLHRTAVNRVLEMCWWHTAQEQRERVPGGLTAPAGRGAAWPWCPPAPRPGAACPPRRGCWSGWGWTRRWRT